MKRLVIAIDCDDVLLTTSPHLVKYYNKTHGTNLELHHMYTPAKLESWGTTDDNEAITRIQKFSQTEEHAAIVPEPEAIEAIKELAKHHELHLVTGRADFLEPITRRMLNTYFPDCFKTIEHTNYLNPAAGATHQRTKGEVCKAIAAHILIDDHVKHGKTALGMVGEVIVFGDYPWNQQELPEGMVRCADWAATTAEVEAYAARQ